MQTVVSKNIRNNWQAETQIELFGDYVLAILTTRRHNGTLSTTATVSVVEGMFKSHRMFHDFSQVVETARPQRVTEKVVCQVHEAALMKIDEIKEAVMAHYKQEIA
jgi:hypothetical protein